MKTPDRIPTRRLTSLLLGRRRRAASLLFAPFALFRAFRSFSCLPLFFAPFVILFCLSSLHAAEPTLARLSFWLPPDRMAEFEAVYNEKVAPILKRHGLVASSERGRATVDSVFARLFELKSPVEVSQKEKALEEDPAWAALLEDLGVRFGASPRTNRVPVHFGLFSTLVGPGRRVPAGPGKSRPAGRGTGHWRMYDSSDGLVDRGVTAIAQDRKGHLWFGNRRYDGAASTILTQEDGLAGDLVRSIFQDRGDNLWFGGRGGVARYDGETFTILTLKDGLPGDFVQSIFQDRGGHLWFGGRHGWVSRYDGSTFTTFTSKDKLAGNIVYAIAQDRTGALWFGTDGGASRYDGKTWTTFDRENGLAGNDVRSIFQDREGNLWVGTYDGLSRYDGESWKSFSQEDGLPDRKVASIYQDREGYLWFGTGNGVCRYDGREFVAFPPEGRLASGNVWSIFQDREGYLWFGNSGGVSRYDGQTFVTVTKEDSLLSSRLRTFSQDRDGNLWLGGIGLTRYDGKTITTLTEKDELLSGRGVWSVFQDREGNIWFGSFGGVSRYDGKTFTTFTEEDGMPMPENWLFSIFQDREGHLWFGTMGGVSRYDGRTSITFTKEDGLAGNNVWCIFQDREGDIWFGTSEGVSRYDGRTFTSFTKKDGLAGNNVWSIFQDREGDIWFGTGGGASRYDGRTFTSFTRKDGLAGNNVWSIFQDREEGIWFGTGGGVSRYDGRVFQVLDRRDGLENNVVIEILQDRKGDIWFGTWTGLTRFRPPEPSPPPIFIDAVVADRRYKEVSELSIPSSVGLTTFEFHGMSFKTRPEAMVYRYRLRGYDEEWKNTHDRRVEYQDLPRGSYTFEVQAVDRDLVYSEAPAAVALTVHLPYERIVWVSVLSIAALLIAYQTARVVRRDRALRVSNTALSDANQELFELNRELREKAGDLEGANRALHREGALERIRMQAQSMEKASDFEEVLSVLAEDLKTVGLYFDTCSIDVLDEPVDEPSMAFFEANGFQHTTYKLDPEGAVTQESYRLPAPFPDINREAIERLIMGKPWQGRSGETAIVEAPISGYQIRFGRLRITAPGREAFTDEEVQTLQEFAAAIALGYARYLDFQRLEAQNRALERANREVREASRRKSAFLANMSHELRTPMNAIKGFTGLVLRRGADRLSERNRDNLDKVVQSADRLLGLINELLDLSRIEAGRVEVNAKPFDVESLITGCCAEIGALLEERAEVALNCDVEEDIGEAHTDPGRLRQIVINLLGNAVKFTERGAITVRARRQDAQLAVAVSDTGSGIPAEALDTIFEEFRQVEGSDPDHKGTGLGLPITEGFAKLLGGSVEVESEEGRGSTFTVRVPMMYRGSTER